MSTVKVTKYHEYFIYLGITIIDLHKLFPTTKFINFAYITKISNFKLSHKILIRKLEITLDVHFFKIRNQFISNLFNLLELGWQLALTIFANRQTGNVKIYEGN